MNDLITIKDLVGIKSFCEEENREIVEYLISKFEKSSKQIIKIKDPITEKNNLIIGVNTLLKNLDNAVILNGHMDTVVANEEEYLTSPYEARIEGGKVYGLGIIDMKCFFASIIDNLDSLAKIKSPLVVCITCDEETCFRGVNEICNELRKRNITPRYTIVGEPTIFKICTCSKGDDEFVVEILGKGCHSSCPGNGINANYIAAKLISYIEKLNKKIDGTTLSCGIMNGGNKGNIVPDQASVTFDVRSNSHKNLNKVKRLINQKLQSLENEYEGSKISIRENFTLTPLEDIEDVGLDRIIKKYNLEKGEFIGGCEAGYFQGLGGKAFLFGNGDLALAHKPNEYMIVEDYFKYNELLLEIITELDKLILGGNYGI